MVNGEWERRLTVNGKWEGGGMTKWKNCELGEFTYRRIHHSLFASGLTIYHLPFTIYP